MGLMGPGKPDGRHAAAAEQARKDANRRENQKAAGEHAGRGGRRI